MKKNLWICFSLVFAVIILCLPAFGQEMPEAEKEVHSITAGDFSKMLYVQDDAGLAGETISVTGFFGGIFKEGTEDVYGLLYLASVDACCAESVLFFPDASCTEFPERNTIISLTGTLMKKETNGFTALRVEDAVLAWE